MMNDININPSTGTTFTQQHNSRNSNTNNTNVSSTATVNDSSTGSTSSSYTPGSGITVLRILCLHDKNSNALQLKEEIFNNLLGDKLYENHQIDLIYLNSPLVVPKNGVSTTTTNNNNDGTKTSCTEQRAWWWCTDNSTNGPWNTNLTNGNNNETNIDNDNVIFLQQQQQYQQPNSYVETVNQHDDVGKNKTYDNVCDDTTTTNSNSNNNTNCTNSNKNHSLQRKYHGMDVSLMLVRQVWTSCPFWGIIGIGQGAAIASLFILTLLYPTATSTTSTTSTTTNAGSSTTTDNNTFMFDDVSNHDDEEGDDIEQFNIQQPLLPPPQIAIFVNGETVLPESERLIDEGRISTLHLIMNDNDHNVNNNNSSNNNDTTVPLPPFVSSAESVSSSSGSESSYKRLIQQFGGIVHKLHRQKTNSSKSFQLHTKDLNRIGRFIIEQKIKFISSIKLSTDTTTTPASASSSSSSSSLGMVSLLLQNELYKTEIIASNIIAQSIMNNPPPALMAIIRPQDVAGWDTSSGRPRRPVGSGGAPCPIEFVRRKEQRRVNTNTTTTTNTNNTHDDDQEQQQQQPGRCHPGTK